jgi:hypothetical protein
VGKRVAMDRVIVERAVKALAAIGAKQQAVPDSSRIAIASRVVESAEPVREWSGLALCGSPDCGGCYEVLPGIRIHPPKCGAGLVQ